MRCKKCGEEYKPGQTFCLRCGSPITDGNVNYSDEFDEYDDYDGDMDGTIGELDVPYDDEQALASGDTEELSELSSGEFRTLRSRENYRTANVVNNRYNNNFEEEIDVSDNDNYSTPYDDDDEDDIYDSARRNRQQKRSNAPRNTSNRNTSYSDKKGKAKKKSIFDNMFVKAVIVLLGFLALAGVVYFASTTIIKSTNNEDFEKYYDKGYKYEENTEYEAAINMYNKATRYALGKEQKIKAYEGMWRCYQQMDGQESQEISILKKLIDIDNTNASYYEALILLYQNTGNSDKIQELIDSATDSKVKEQLKGFDASKPVPSIEPGIYNKSISVALTAQEGAKIYYTLDNTEPTTSSEVYENKFKFKKNGTYTIKAFAVSTDGTVSEVLTAEYVIEKGTIDPPVVTPDSGEYTDRTTITVEVPDNATVYYTDNEDETPSKKSKKYTPGSEIVLPEGNSIYKFIAYNEGGVASDVVTKIYVYKPNFSYSYDSARDILLSHLVSTGKLSTTEEYTEDGSITMVTSRGITKQSKSSDDDNSKEYTHYYIMEVEHKDADGNTTFSGTYAVGCNNGTVYGASGSGDNYSITKD